MIEGIKEYQKEMGYDYYAMSHLEKMQALRNYTVALMMEQAELLDEVSWKPWRTIESQKPNPDKKAVAREWVDMLFFLVDQSFCLDLTAQDIEDAFVRVLVNNRSRIQSGYSHVKNDKTSKLTKRRKRS